MTATPVTYERPTYTTSNIHALDLKPGDVAYLGGQLLVANVDQRGVNLRRSGKTPKEWRKVHFLFAEAKRDGSQDTIPWVQVDVDTGDPLDGFTRILTLRLRPYDLVRVQRQKESA